MNERNDNSGFHSGLAGERAALLPRLAHALWAWDAAALELGECAVVTSGSADAALYCLVAAWRTGRTPLYVNVDEGRGLSGDLVSVIDAAEPQSAIEALTTRLGAAPGAAAVILSSSARAVDLLFEAMPTWGRIVLAAQAAEPTAIDFYNHVHRKGVRLLGISPAAAGPPGADLPPEAALHFRRALGILQHDRLAERCLRAVA